MFFQIVFDDRTLNAFSKEKPQSSKINSIDILKTKPGLTEYGKAEDELECFEKFFTKEIFEKILYYTNLYLEEEGEDICSKEELLAVIGILLIIASSKSSAENKFLWEEAIFSGIMSRNRYEVLWNAIRFDDKETRIDRLKTDNFDAFREIFDSINANFRKAYIPSFHLRIDEMFYLFKGRCKYKIYMPSKPCRYGLLYRSLVCNEAKYVLNVEVFCGVSGEPNMPINIVKRLLQPYSGMSYNVTMDRFYNSVELTEDLCNDHLTIFVNFIL